ncbi:MAG: hypothetical protein ACOX6G_07900 [Christensenellales bacterium]
MAFISFQKNKDSLCCPNGRRVVVLSANTDTRQKIGHAHLHAAHHHDGTIDHESASFAKIEIMLT